MIGQKLSHYEVLEQLGRGGMGVVYKARDTRLNRLVALKLLPPELASDASRVELLRREAQAIAALNHPRIVTIYAVEEAEEQLFLTMEYVEGQALDREIPEQGFELQRLLKIAIPLADAVAAAHDSGIVHRDLKPANIILSKEDRPKILDFGLARLRPGEATSLATRDGAPPASRPPIHAVTLEGTMAGTIPYMSPEQLSGGTVDHRTDIFSLGVILYEMATGRHPFGGAIPTVASAILNNRPDSVADIRAGLPRQLGRIIRRCLQKKPAERVQSARDVRNALDDLRRELARPAGPTTAKQAGRLRRAAAPLLLGAVLLATLGWLLVRQFAGHAAPSHPSYVAVEATRIFPGDRGPDYVRQGFVDSLRRRLTGLPGVYVLGDRGPLPDVTALVDTRASAETVAVGFRLQADGATSGQGDGVVEGSRKDLPRLLANSARSIAAALARDLDLGGEYRPAELPTRDGEAFDLYLQAAAAAGANGEPAGAAAAHRLLDEALRRDPEFALAHLLAGQIDLRTHRAGAASDALVAAETRCRKATELDPRLGAAYTCVGEVLMLRDRNLEAVAALTRALELDTSDLTPHEALRRAHRDLGLPASAERTWQRLIGKHPTYWAGHYSLGGYYQDLERYEDALAQYQKALELAPREPDVHAFIGTVYTYLGRFEEATVALQRSIEIRPTWDAYYNLGGVYFNLRRFDAAVAAYQDAVRLAPSNYRSHGRLGWASYWMPGGRDDARIHLRRAIQLATADDPDALILTALFQAMLGEREPSIAALEKALELHPNDSHYFYLAGLATNYLGDTDQAIAWLERAVRGGFSTAEIRNVVDLDNLHGDPRFQELLRKAAASPT